MRSSWVLVTLCALLITALVVAPVASDHPELRGMCDTIQPRHSVPHRSTDRPAASHWIEDEEFGEFDSDPAELLGTSPSAVRSTCLRG